MLIRSFGCIFIEMYLAISVHMYIYAIRTDWILCYSIIAPLAQVIIFKIVSILSFWAAAISFVLLFCHSFFLFMKEKNAIGHTTVCAFVAIGIITKVFFSTILNVCCRKKIFWTDFLFLSRKFLANSIYVCSK